MTAPTGEHQRRSARVLLLDDEGRVLLFRCLLNAADPSAGDLWMAPGGGVEDGESLAEAASRELREETGVSVDADALGEAVAVSSGYANLGWASGVFRDDYFVARVAAPVIDTSGLLAGLEKDTFVEHRWWSADELAATEETVVPSRLAALVTTLADGRPPHPVRLPWHH